MSKTLGVYGGHDAGISLEDDIPTASVAGGLAPTDAAHAAVIDAVDPAEDAGQGTPHPVARSETTAPDMMPQSEPSADGGTNGLIDPQSEVAYYDTDLSAIPGAGPGLIWMLWNASVRNLDDLAAARPADLQAALGPVGVILDVEALIAFAREGQKQTG
ncbi:MAG: hypothetical protein AAFW64_00090 [Pseudomonadota bacterium]